MSTSVTFVTSEASGPVQSEIARLALSPRRVRTDEGTVEERPIDDLIMAQQFTDLTLQSVPWGIGFARTKPSNAHGDQKAPQE